MTTKRKERKAESDKYIKLVQTYVTKEQKDGLEKIAKEEGLAISSFLRRIIISKVKDEE